MNMRPILFIGHDEQVRRSIVPDNHMNMRVVSKCTDIEGFIEADIFWIGDYWTLPDYEQIRTAIYRMKDVRQFQIR